MSTMKLKFYFDEELNYGTVNKIKSVLEKDHFNVAISSQGMRKNATRSLDSRLIFFTRHFLEIETNTPMSLEKKLQTLKAHQDEHIKKAFKTFVYIVDDIKDHKPSTPIIPIEILFHQYDLKKSKYCYIIGAGAHVPYSFPTGQQLKNFIRNLNSNFSIFDKDEKSSPYRYDNEIIRKFKKSLTSSVIDNFPILESCNNKKLYTSILIRDTHNSSLKLIEKILSDFIEDFIDAGDETIDSFLAEHPNWAPFGKLLLASIIRFFETEKGDPLYSSPDDWLLEFINRYVNDVIDHPTVAGQKSLKDFPNIITFNYDRLLEEVIYRRLLKKLHLSPDDAKAIVESLPIHHVYGQVGTKTFKELKDISFADIFNESEMIKVMKEKREESIDHETIAKYLIESRNLCFMGFGFDETNTKILCGKDNEIRDFSNVLYEKIIGTKMGISLKRESEVTEWTDGFIDLSKGFQDFDCDKFLKNCVD